MMLPFSWSLSTHQDWGTAIEVDTVHQAFPQAPFKQWCSVEIHGRTDVLPQDLVKSRSRKIRVYNDRSALTLDRHLGNAAAEMLVKCQNDWKSLNPNLAASSRDMILE